MRVFIYTYEYLSPGCFRKDFIDSGFTITDLNNENEELLFIYKRKLKNYFNHTFVETFMHIVRFITI